MKLQTLAFVGIVAVLSPFSAFAAEVGVSANASSETQIMCPMIYKPVCALKQVQCIKAPCYPVYQTYGNTCQMGADRGTTFVHDGECTASETGQAKPDTVITTTTVHTEPSPVIDTSVEVEATTTADATTTDTETHSGFFARIWASITAWFSWH